MFALLNDTRDDDLIDLNAPGSGWGVAQTATTLDPSFAPVTSGPGAVLIDPDTAEVIYQPDGTELEGDTISIAYQLVDPDGRTELGLIMFRYAADDPDDADDRVELQDLTDDTMLTITQVADPVDDGTAPVVGPVVEEDAAQTGAPFWDVLPVTSVLPEHGTVEDEDDAFDYLTEL